MFQNDLRLLGVNAPPHTNVFVTFPTVDAEGLEWSGPLMLEVEDKEKVFYYMARSRTDLRNRESKH